MATVPYKTLDDIIQGCVRQERSAQRALYDTYARKMAAVCLRYVGDRDTALDLTHDGFILLFDKIGSFKNIGAFDGWIRRLFTNVALEYLRKNDILKNSDDVDSVEYMTYSEDENPFERLSAQEIMGFINELNAVQRTVFNLFAIEGFSHAEIADKLEMNEATVRSHFLRAKKILRKKIEDGDAE